MLVLASPSQRRNDCDITEQWQHIQTWDYEVKPTSVVCGYRDASVMQNSLYSAIRNDNAIRYNVMDVCSSCFLLEPDGSLFFTGSGALESCHTNINS